MLSHLPSILLILDSIQCCIMLLIFHGLPQDFRFQAVHCFTRTTPRMAQYSRGKVKKFGKQFLVLKVQYKLHIVQVYGLVELQNVLHTPQTSASDVCQSTLALLQCQRGLFIVSSRLKKGLCQPLSRFSATFFTNMIT